MKNFFKSYDFGRGLLVAFSMLFFGLILYFVGASTAIPGVLVGVLLTAFCDLQGDFKQRVVTMGLSVAMNFVSFVIINYSMCNTPLLFVVMGVLFFFISYLGVFGHRANMLAFSGLMGVVLSMVKPFEGIEIWRHVLLMSAGGLSYIVVSSIFHFITKKHQINEKLADLIQLNAEYIHLQWQRNQANPSVNESQRLNLHHQITTQQESLRQLLFTNELFGGSSKTRNRQMLTLVELIDIAEMVTANPIDMHTLREHPKWDEKLFKDFQDELYRQYEKLKNLEAFLRSDKPLDFNDEHSLNVDILSKKIDDFAHENGIIQVRPITMSLLNYLSYLKNQESKIKNLHYLLKNKKVEILPVLISYRDKFVNSEDYSFRGFRESFQISSPVMRHSIRLTVSMLLGYFIGLVLKFENPYWIMITVLVIMRPNFGLTKKRSVERVLGTFIGVLIAVGIVYFTDNIYVYMAVALVNTVFGFSLLNRNYFLASIAITLNVVFAFFLIQPDPWSVIQYRFLDTLIGAIVCTIVAYTILPYWEYKSLKSTMKDTLVANQNYIHEIINYFLYPESDIQYRLSRKKSFAAAGELNAAFQRFTQDPKSKQNNASIYYDWMVINQNLLSSLASLGSYVQTQQPPEIKEGFQQSLQVVAQGLQKVEDILDNKLVDLNLLTFDTKIDELWSNIEQKRDLELVDGNKPISEEMLLEMRALSHVKQELDWLNELIQKLIEVTKSLKLSEEVKSN